MAGGTFTIVGLAASEPAGQRTFGPLTIQGTQVVGETLEVPLVSGDNTFAVPVGAVAVMVIPPTTGTVALKLRTNTNAADGGLVLPSVNMPMVYPFPPTAPTSLIVNSSAPQTAPLTVVFI
jgi:hypothetical protein